MTEAEWLTCDDPAKMLRFVRLDLTNPPTPTGYFNRISDRKLRLACHAVLLGCDKDVPNDEWQASGDLSKWARSCFIEVAMPKSLLSRYPSLDRCGILRDIIGNPWRPVTLYDTDEVKKWEDANNRPLPAGNAAMATMRFYADKINEAKSRKPYWLTPAVADLAQTIYDGRAFELMPILADALEEAGCHDVDIVEHCRGPEPHVRGCWVLDLLLGKS